MIAHLLQHPFRASDFACVGKEPKQLRRNDHQHGAITSCTSHVYINVLPSVVPSLEKQIRQHSMDVTFRARLLARFESLNLFCGVAVTAEPPKHNDAQTRATEEARLRISDLCSRTIL